MNGIGAWKNFAIGGRRVAGIITGEVDHGFVDVPSRNPDRNGATVRLPTQHANAITLRDRNPNGANANEPPYLTMSYENLNPRFAFDRYEPVVGLDVDEDGAVITLAALIAEAEESTLEYQRQRLALRAEPSVPLLSAEAAAALATE